jgi:hypothetical protein
MRLRTQRYCGAALLVTCVRLTRGGVSPAAAASSAILSRTRRSTPRRAQASRVLMRRGAVMAYAASCSRYLPPVVRRKAWRDATRE